MPGFKCLTCGAVATTMSTCGTCFVPMQPDTFPPFTIGKSTPSKPKPKPKPKTLVNRSKASLPKTNLGSPFASLPFPPVTTAPVIIPSLLQKLRIIHFDVSQGESTLLSYTDESARTQKHVLIDGGRQGRGVYVRRCLKKLNITHLDYVICTHADNDHYEGLFSVARSSKIKIGQMLLSHDGAYEDYQKKYKKIQERCTLAGVKYAVAKTGPLIQDGPFTLEIKYVGKPKDKEGNHASIACFVSMNSFRYYTAGDLPSDLENNLLGKTHVCAFKCGHHGAAGSTSTEFVSDISPTAAFLSAGRHGHGHPHQPVLTNLLNQDTVQRFYVTQCIPTRLGFNTGEKGLVAAQRKSGVLGHLVLYTDNLLSAMHGSNAVNFRVFIPRQGGGGWRQFDHACGKTGLPTESVPFMPPVPMPEHRISTLSKTVDDFASSWGQLHTGKPLLRPSSPVSYFLEDQENFTDDNAKTGTVQITWQEPEHISEEKAMSFCFVCHTKSVLSSRKKMRLDISTSTITVRCSHDVSFYLCSDCFEEEYNEDKKALSELSDDELCDNHG